MKSTLYYICDDSAECDEEFVRTALSELCTFLRREPLQLALEPAQLKGPFWGKLVPRIRKDGLRGAWAGFQLMRVDDVLQRKSRLVIYCSPHSWMAADALKRNPKALWGTANASVALVYKLRHRPVLWHEVLHTFGANDCYHLATLDVNPGPDCGLQNCLMKYEPKELDIATWPFLCSKNIKLIQRQTNGPL